MGQAALTWLPAVYKLSCRAGLSTRVSRHCCTGRRYPCVTPHHRPKWVHGSATRLKTKTYTWSRQQRADAMPHSQNHHHGEQKTAATPQELCCAHTLAQHMLWGCREHMAMIAAAAAIIRTRGSLRSGDLCTAEGISTAASFGEVKAQHLCRSCALGTPTLDAARPAASMAVTVGVSRPPVVGSGKTCTVSPASMQQRLLAGRNGP
jgi:hypothetical protein